MTSFASARAPAHVSTLPTITSHARHALRNADRTQAREHFEKAEALVQDTGYHRRDPDLEKLRAELAAQTT
jgi:hypothetical protein